LRQRIVALAAAYLIALAGLLASFSTASAAADINNSAGLICHTASSGQSSPSDNQGKDTTCAECCGVGCLMLLAALPPPPMTAVPLPRLAGDIIHPATSRVAVAAQHINSHRSRAPPQTA
jgi:hypothetical protein